MKLEHCPHCGGECRVVNSGPMTTPTVVVEMVRVVCRVCHAMGPTFQRDADAVEEHNRIAGWVRKGRDA